MALNTPQAWLITYDAATPNASCDCTAFCASTRCRCSIQCSLRRQRRGSRATDRANRSPHRPATDDVRACQLPEHLSIDTLGAAAFRATPTSSRKPTRPGHPSSRGRTVNSMHIRTPASDRILTLGFGTSQNLAGTPVAGTEWKEFFQSLQSEHLP